MRAARRALLAAALPLLAAAPPSQVVVVEDPQEINRWVEGLAARRAARDAATLAGLFEGKSDTDLARMPGVWDRTPEARRTSLRVHVRRAPTSLLRGAASALFAIPDRDLSATLTRRVAQDRTLFEAALEGFLPTTSEARPAVALPAALERLVLENLTSDDPDNVRIAYVFCGQYPLPSAVPRIERAADRLPPQLLDQAVLALALGGRTLDRRLDPRIESLFVRTSLVTIGLDDRLRSLGTLAALSGFDAIAARAADRLRRELRKVATTPSPASEGFYSYADDAVDAAIAGLLPWAQPDDVPLLLQLLRRRPRGPGAGPLAEVIVELAPARPGDGQTALRELLTILPYGVEALAPALQKAGAPGAVGRADLNRFRKDQNAIVTALARVRPTSAAERLALVRALVAVGTPRAWKAAGHFATERGIGRGVQAAMREVLQALPVDRVVEELRFHGAVRDVRVAKERVRELARPGVVPTTKELVVAALAAVAIATDGEGFVVDPVGALDELAAAESAQGDGNVAAALERATLEWAPEGGVSVGGFDRSLPTLGLRFTSSASATDILVLVQARGVGQSLALGDLLAFVEQAAQIDAGQERRQDGEMAFVPLWASEQGVVVAWSNVRAIRGSLRRLGVR